MRTGLALTPRGEVTIGQARKFLQEGAVLVNGAKTLDANAEMSRSEALFGRYCLLRRGKKHFHLVAWR